MVELDVWTIFILLFCLLLVYCIWQSYCGEKLKFSRSSNCDKLHKSWPNIIDKLSNLHCKNYVLFNIRFDENTKKTTFPKKKNNNNYNNNNVS